jgi:hypothetical protein
MPKYPGVEGRALPAKMNRQTVTAAENGNVHPNALNSR